MFTIETTRRYEAEGNQPERTITHRSHYHNAEEVAFELLALCMRDGDTDKCSIVTEGDHPKISETTISQLTERVAALSESTDVMPSFSIYRRTRKEAIGLHCIRVSPVRFEDEPK